MTNSNTPRHKQLSARAHAAVLQRARERDHYLFLATCLSQSIERVVEQDTGIRLDDGRGDWTLDVAEGMVVRHAAQR